jgi:molybdopterin/thiamine biosynthesis adenylyltransferase
MALANFFDKINLGAAQIIKNHDRSAFETKLLSNCVGLYFNASALQSYEGRVALDLLTRLLSRLYPNIKFKNPDHTEDKLGYIKQLKSIAREINPKIDLGDEQEETFIISVGCAPTHSGSVPVLYLGSDDWKAYHSTTTPQTVGSSQNPFGAASAACITCSNLFRAMFSEELGKPLLDENICFSTFSQTIQPSESEPGLPMEVPINFTLVGAGAIGNAALWALLQLSNARGRVSLIDKETVSLSNLQRYVLMMQNHVDHPKVEVIREIFKNRNSGLIIEPFPSAWQEVVGILQSNQLRLLATAIDTKAERLLIQSVLPQKIINAWTSPDCLGVSRHFDFLNEVCLSCLYFPSMKVRSESQKIADALNMGQNEPFIRSYLAKNIPIDEQFIATTNEVGGIELEKLSLYKNQPVRVLYSEGICGGRVLSVQTDGQVPQDMEVPLAHESALAGILLAAEVVIDALQLRQEPIEPLTKLNLMRPLHPYMREKEKKNYSGKCLCQDEVFQKRYSEKWSGA